MGELAQLVADKILFCPTVYKLAVEFCIFESSKSPLQDVQNVNDLKKEGLFKIIFFYLVQQLQLFLHNRFLHSLVTEVNDYSLIK